MGHPGILIRGKGREDVRDYNHIKLEEGDVANKAKLEYWVAKTLGTELTRHYPNREWSVTVDVDAGTAIVRCPSVSQKKGFVLTLRRSLKELAGLMMSVGGEILERAGASRNRIFNQDNLETLQRDYLDEVVTPDMLTPEERRKFGG